ncbi:MAG: ABC transporter substrate-binding protein [Saprospiraceae bacterium]|nr:ABC transporter substrate-binding protein [Bacteroidia bacterium]NNE15971.1 ABC transporter substrate-binding protein [Saprospiraceae bacterium]NNL92109.1 ABC transporter substrate-binding protein [Saprospiraceae bacterium]
MRIISTVPSQTELLFDLGLDEAVIGITKFCIHPKEWFKSKEKIGGTKTLNVQKIIDLKPDLIIGNKEENSKDQIQVLQKQFQTHITDIKTVEDNIQLIHKIGDLTGTANKAKDIIIQLENTIFNIAVKNKERKKAIYLIWKNPYMTVGGDTFINSMMEKCGFENIYKSLLRYPEIKLEDIEAASADYILLSSEPFPFREKHVDELKRISPNSKIILVDGEAFSWYGTRIIKKEAYLKNLIETIHS